MVVAYPHRLCQAVAGFMIWVWRLRGFSMPPSMDEDLLQGLKPKTVASYRREVHQFMDSCQCCGLQFFVPREMDEAIVAYAKAMRNP